MTNEIATVSEKIAALDALTEEDYGKLLKFAEYTARKFRGTVHHADAEDLLHTVLVQLYDEKNTRKWYPHNADFKVFLKGCIRSSASAWFKRARPTEPPDDLVFPFSHDKQVEAAITIEKIRRSLVGRPHAVEIFDLKCEGLTAEEIQLFLRISERIYAAAVKWIDRSLKQGGFRQCRNAPRLQDRYRPPRSSKISTTASPTMPSTARSK